MEKAMTSGLDDAIGAVAVATGLSADSVQIKYDLRDLDPEGGPPMPWTVEVSLPPKRKGGATREIQGYGVTLPEAATEAIAAVERHR